MPVLSPKTEGDLVRLLMGCLLFRLGGQQVFTAQEIDDIKKTVGGVQIGLDPDDAIVLRVKSPEFMPQVPGDVL